MSAFIMKYVWERDDEISFSGNAKTALELSENTVVGISPDYLSYKKDAVTILKVKDLYSRFRLREMIITDFGVFDEAREKRFLSMLYSLSEYVENTSHQVWVKHITSDNQIFQLGIIGAIIRILCLARKSLWQLSIFNQFDDIHLVKKIFMSYMFQKKSKVKNNWY
eukprot:snap_masked-scaffold_45-processed-gene-0.49-mRNA-1 protein AED:1.00 eAED:1.00 QI:0/-1/0/0/-1/1/1/0/165